MRTLLDTKTLLPKLLKEEHKEYLNEFHTKKMGSLMYAKIATRLDLTFAISMVNRFRSKLGLYVVDGGHANHAILEGHLRYEVAHWWQTFQPKRLFHRELG